MPVAARADEFVEDALLDKLGGADLDGALVYGNLRPVPVEIPDHYVELLPLIDRPVDTVTATGASYLVTIRCAVRLMRYQMESVDLKEGDALRKLYRLADAVSKAVTDGAFSLTAYTSEHVACSANVIRDAASTPNAGQVTRGNAVVARDVLLRFRLTTEYTP